MKIKKIILIISIIFIIFMLFFYQSSFAAYSTNIEDFGGKTSDASDKISASLGKTLNIVQIISLGMAIIMLIALAIKYMAASASDRAEIKKHAVIYVVGAVLMFGASGIIQIIRTFAEDTFN